MVKITDHQMHYYTDICQKFEFFLKKTKAFCKKNAQKLSCVNDKLSTELSAIVTLIKKLEFSSEFPPNKDQAEPITSLDKKKTKKNNLKQSNPIKTSTNLNIKDQSEPQIYNNDIQIKSETVSPLMRCNEAKTENKNNNEEFLRYLAKEGKSNIYNTAKNYDNLKNAVNFKVCTTNNTTEKKKDGQSNSYVDFGRKYSDINNSKNILNIPNIISSPVRNKDYPAYSKRK